MPPKIIETSLDDVLIIEPQVFGDERGFFFESFNAGDFAALIDPTISFVQDNHSRSVGGVLRGLHFQRQFPQAKIVRVLAGEIYDVAVDVRTNSLNFGKWVGVYLSADNKRQLWIPPGFAHGFLVTSGFAEVMYKAGDYYHPEDEGVIRWDDPAIAIEWPLSGNPILSKKDLNGKSLSATFSL